MTLNIGKKISGNDPFRPNNHYKVMDAVLYPPENKAPFYVPKQTIAQVTQQLAVKK